jgi:hypothetical protein
LVVGHCGFVVGGSESAIRFISGFKLGHFRLKTYSGQYLDINSTTALDLIPLSGYKIIPVISW